MSRLIFARRRWYQGWNWGLILVVVSCLIIWAGFIYWIVGLV